jgi:hypothetical protein
LHRATKHAKVDRHHTIEGEVLAILNQKPLVNVGRVLKVCAQIVDGGEAQLILGRLAQVAMVRHQPRLVAELVRDLKEQPVLQSSGGTLLRLGVGLLVQPEGKEAARGIQMVRRVGVGHGEQCAVGLRGRNETGDGWVGCEQVKNKR